MVKTTLTDKEIEKLWDELGNITMVEDENRKLVLNSGFYIWKAGTTQTDIWGWFNRNYSKGILWLLYERE